MCVVNMIVIGTIKEAVGSCVRGLLFFYALKVGLGGFCSAKMRVKCVIDALLILLS